MLFVSLWIHHCETIEKSFQKICNTMLNKDLNKHFFDHVENKTRIIMQQSNIINIADG